jgi:hypothetical protein
MTLAQVRKYALSLHSTFEEPHFDRTSFRVDGKIFVTAKPQDTHIHVFVPEEVREPALAMHSDYLSKLLWGGKVVGLRVELPNAQLDVVKDLVSAAWQSRHKPQGGKARARMRS